MREIMFTGPEPGPGSQFCVMCALFYKAQIMDLPGVQDAIQAALRGDAAEGTAVMALEELAAGRPVPHLAHAVAFGICQPMNNALVPLCWSHLAGVKFTAVMPGSAGQMPGGQPVPLIGRR